MGKVGGAMNNKSKYVWGTLSLVFFSIAFTALWLRTPVLWFINLPKSVWESLAIRLDQTCCERTADLEIVVGLGVGLLIGLFLMLVFFGITRTRRRK